MNRELVRMATQSAWAILRALEKPGDEMPTGTEIRTACRNARLLADVCDRLNPDELEEELADNLTPFAY